MTDFWKQRRVMVTGATGLLGSWMTKELLARGAEVTVLVRDWMPRSLLVTSGDYDKVSVVRGELEDHATVLRGLNEYEIDTVFHLGAQTIVGTAMRSAMSTFEANIRGTWSLLEACRANKMVKRVVIASSDKAYGEHEKLPYTEELPLQGTFPYDVSKACTELIARSYHQTYGVPLAITRCGNLFGGGDLNFNRLIPGTIRAALNGEQPIVRSDGKFLRDYFYVEDAVGAYLLLAERLEQDGLAGEAFNFGTEQPMDVLAVVAKILERLGRTDLEPVILNEASNEIRAQYLDCTKARTRLGWQSQFAFEECLDRTIEWYRTNT
jgi:CDP-glucose 4,6-dehydratase